jgi:chemotaxis response regulator CheB
MPVLVADADDRFHVGKCYIGEPAAHLTLAARSSVGLVEGANDRYRNRTIDLLFASVAAHARQRGIGVIVSGALDDGSRGLAAIRQAGGATMVLTEAGLARSGMPQNASVYDGPIDLMGSVDEIAAEIARRVGG